MKNIRKTIKSVLGYSACLRHLKCIQNHEFLMILIKSVHFFMYFMIFSNKNVKFCTGIRWSTQNIKKHKNNVLRAKSGQKFYKFLINSSKNQANSWVSELVIDRNVFYIFYVFWWSSYPSADLNIFVRKNHEIHEKVYGFDQYHKKFMVLDTFRVS